MKKNCVIPFTVAFSIAIAIVHSQNDTTEVLESLSQAKIRKNNSKPFEIINANSLFLVMGAGLIAIIIVMCVFFIAYKICRKAKNKGAVTKEDDKKSTQSSNPSLLSMISTKQSDEFVQIRNPLPQIEGQMPEICEERPIELIDMPVDTRVSLDYLRVWIGGKMS